MHRFWKQGFLPENLMRDEGRIQNTGATEAYGYKPTPLASAASVASRVL